MEKDRSKKDRILSVIFRSVGIALSPPTFAFILALTFVLAFNETFGDIVGYGQLLFMKRPVYTEAESIFEPSSKESGTVNIADIEFPKYERVYGHIEIESGPVDCPLVYGDTETAMSRGAGQYIGSRIIGYGGTTLVCAHVNRQFSELHNVKKDDYIKVTTEYGAYVYRVTYAGVNSADDNSVYDLSREDENLVLYTCYYQQTEFGSVKMRYFVCADYISGPMLINGEAKK